MTAEPDLLPLPEMDIYALGSGVGLRDVRHTPVGFSQKKMSEYARACVAHATAAKDAEVEALRAEVEMLRDAFSDEDMTAGAHWFGRYVEQKRRAEQLAEEVEPLRAGSDFLGSVIATHAADTREYQKRISQAEARAERLAEALRDAADDLERGIDARIVVAQARAALRDQEEGQ